MMLIKVCVTALLLFSAGMSLAIETPYYQDEISVSESFIDEVEEQLGNKKFRQAYRDSLDGFWVSHIPDLTVGNLCRIRLFYGELHENSPIINKPIYIRKVRYFYYLGRIGIEQSDCNEIPLEDYFEVTTPIEEGGLRELVVFLDSELEKISRENSMRCEECSEFVLVALEIPGFASLLDKYSYRVVFRDVNSSYFFIGDVERSNGKYVLHSIHKLNKDAHK